MFYRKDAAEKNQELEFERNKERFMFLKVSVAFYCFNVTAQQVYHHDLIIQSKFELLLFVFFIGCSGAPKLFRICSLSLQDLVLFTRSISSI